MYENYCLLIDHISRTVIYYMVILLHINKITFEKSENVEKETHISQNLAKMLTENCCLF